MSENIESASNPQLDTALRERGLPTVSDALGYSRNFAAANPALSQTTRGHIEGLCNMLEIAAAPLPQQPTAEGVLPLKARPDFLAGYDAGVQDEKLMQAGRADREAVLFQIRSRENPEAEGWQTVDRRYYDGRLIGHYCDSKWERRALYAHQRPAAVNYQTTADGDMVLVERGLIGAACHAIEKKRDAPTVLAKLRAVTFAKAEPARTDTVEVHVNAVEGEGGSQILYTQSAAQISPGAKLYAAHLPLTEAQIRQGWESTFSTTNPYCPCDLKTFTKAVRWAEHELAGPAR